MHQLYIFIDLVKDIGLNFMIFDAVENESEV